MSGRTKDSRAGLVTKQKGVELNSEDIKREINQIARDLNQRRVRRHGTGNTRVRHQ